MAKSVVWVLAGNTLGLQLDALHERLAGSLHGGSVGLLSRLLQPGVVLHGEFAVNGEPYDVGVLAGQADGEFDTLLAAGNDGHVFGILLRGQHGGQQACQLHFTPDAAGLDVAQHALEVAHAVGKALHLAKTAIDLLQPLGDQGEGLRQTLIQ